MPWPKSSQWLKWATRFSDPPVQCPQGDGQSCFFYPCSFIKQTVGFTHTVQPVDLSSLTHPIPWELWKGGWKVLRYVLARIWRSWKSSSTSAQRMQLSPCDRHSAGNEFSWLPERPWQPTCQPWVKGRIKQWRTGRWWSRFNGCERTDWQSYSWEHGRDQQIMGMGIATTNC